MCSNILSSILNFLQRFWNWLTGNSYKRIMQNSVKTKCLHQGLTTLGKRITNITKFDAEQIVNNSTPYLTINAKFYERARELNNCNVTKYKHVEKLIKKYDPVLRNRKLEILEILHYEYGSDFIAWINNVKTVATEYLCCVPEKLPLLVQRNQGLVYLSQFQIACILANIFFSNEPYEIADRYKKDYPYLCFRRLFISEYESDQFLKCEKLKFIFSYFDKLVDPESNGAVTFQRQISNQPNWADSDRKLTDVEFSLESMEIGVEKGYCEVDFANEMIGGGVLGQGAVQEEICFLLSPELIITRLFTQKLLPNEAVVITGTQRFSIGEGYSNHFRFTSKYYDAREFDELNRRSSQIIAIDAVRFSPYEKDVQFKEEFINRELNKAFAGFQRTADSLQGTIASGKWGCGAFNGDPYLKCFIQMIAATEGDRNLVIYTLNDGKFCDDMKFIYRYLREHKVTISELYQYLLDYLPYREDGQFILEFVYIKVKERENVGSFYQVHNTMNELSCHLDGNDVKRTFSSSSEKDMELDEN